MKAGADRGLSLGLGVVASVCVWLAMLAPTAAASVPRDPVSFTVGTPLLIDGSGVSYWTHVPTSYDESHNTPTTLFVWLHGCGGYSSGDIWNVRAGTGQRWISIAPTGREGGCWGVNVDPSKVLAAVADAETHFNINPRRVILGGYSSGGDLAYRTAFYNANLFAGVLAENTAPFRDTGSSQVDSIAAAAWKFNVIHLAHNQDMTYPVGLIEDETDAMIAAGFPVDLIKRDGTHYDSADAVVNGSPVPGTNKDLRDLLLAHIDVDGWLAPEAVPDPDPDPKPDPKPDPDPGLKPGPATTPKVKMKAAPNKRTRSRKANFRFKASVAGSTFKCSIDGRKFHKCVSPKRFRHLGNGRHTFRVKAIANGVSSRVDRYSWRVLKP